MTIKQFVFIQNSRFFFRQIIFKSALCDLLNHILLYYLTCQSSFIHVQRYYISRKKKVPLNGPIPVSILHQPVEKNVSFEYFLFVVDLFMLQSSRNIFPLRFYFMFWMLQSLKTSGLIYLHMSSRNLQIKIFWVIIPLCTSI